MATPSFSTDRDSAPALDRLPGLLTRVAQGDRIAFRQLYDIAAPQLFGVATALMRRRDLAEDLLQEAFLAIWQKAAQFSCDRGTPMAWMAMIVRHRAIDRLRAAKRRPQDAATEDAAQIDRVCAGLPSDAAGRDVSKALASLPNAQRNAIILAFVEGLTHEELALRLDAPLGTVKSWIRRGLQAMKESMAL